MLLRLLLALTCVSALHTMLGAAWVRVSDPDVWWVAAAGRNMLRQYAVPSQNVFSFVEPAHAWIMHEWALGPVYALGLTQLGPAFFPLLAVCVLGCGLFLIVNATLARAQQPLAGALLACVSVLFFVGRLQSARPTAVSLLFPLALTSLAFGARFTHRQLLLCVLSEWLWTNVHGSFPVGVLLLLAASAEQSRDRPLRLIAAGAAAAVTLINPYGVRLHGFVWNYFTGREGVYRGIHAAIPEFGSLWSAWGSLVTLSDLLGFAVVTSMALAALWRPQSRVRGVVCCGLLLLALRQARHLQLAGLVSCMLLVPWADAWVQGWHQPEALDATPRRRMLAWLLAPAYALGALTFGSAEVQRAKPQDWISDELAYLNALPSVADGARLFVPFQAAGLAIWQGFPRGVRVFFDSRNDCYSLQTLRDFASLSGASRDQPSTLPAVRAILDASGTDAVLVPHAHPLAAMLTHAPEWQHIERDHASVFVRKPRGLAAR